MNPYKKNLQHEENNRIINREQYHDLISAADAIITMSKNAQAIQSNFERLQTSCNVKSIKLNAQKSLKERDEKSNQSNKVTATIFYGSVSYTNTLI